MQTRSDNIYEILQSAPCQRMTIVDIRRNLVLNYADSLQKVAGATIYSTVRGNNNVRVTNGKAKRFNYSGDGSEASGYISLAESGEKINIEYEPKFETDTLNSEDIVKTVQDLDCNDQEINYQEIKTLIIDDKMMDLVYKAIEIAVKYEEVSRGTRKMPITGEIGEILICKQLGLNLIADFQFAGIDAVDKSGLKVQIKTRREDQDKQKGNQFRIGRFSEHYFDYALVGILDKKYRLREVWRAEYADLKPIIDNDKKRNPNMSSFKRVAERVV